MDTFGLRTRRGIGEGLAVKDVAVLRADRTVGDGGGKVPVTEIYKFGGIALVTP